MTLLAIERDFLMKRIVLGIILALFSAGQFVPVTSGEQENTPCHVLAPAPQYSGPSEPKSIPVRPHVDDSQELIVFQILICESPWDENGTLADILADRISDTTSPANETLAGNEIFDMVKQLETEKKLTVLSRPQIATLNKQTASMIVGDRDKNGQTYGTFLTIKPRIWNDRILTNIDLLYRDRNQQGQPEQVHVSTIVPLQNGVPFFVGGLLFQSNSDLPEKEVALCITALRVIPPKIPASSDSVVFYEEPTRQ